MFVYEIILHGNNDPVLDWTKFSKNRIQVAIEINKYGVEVNKS